jgi:hypothetical protein
MRRRSSTKWPIAAALAALVAFPVVNAAAATTHSAPAQAKLVGVWHKNMTKAQWDRVGVSRPIGVFTIVVKRSGNVTVYLPGAYRPHCTTCEEDFETSIATKGARLRLGGVPVCSFKGTYAWTVVARTLTLEPVSDKRCPVRETFFGGHWKR